MRNHEYYFGALENGAKKFNPESKLGQILIKQYGSFEDFKEVIKNVAMTRGPGWTMLYYDKKAEEKKLIVGWIDEHHLGYLSSLDLLLAIDMWEHAFMVDYLPGEKGKYLESYLENLNWEVVENWFKEASL
jgi:Fe-Mn family superoxide dismutase